MYRNPFFDAYLGAAAALGGPLAFLLPQRIALEMLRPVSPAPRPERERIETR